MAERVTLNIGGKIFVTRRQTLQTLKGTRLSLLTTTSPEYDETNAEFFFDRNPLVFGQILDLYRTGVVHFPKCMCGPYLKAELEFWGISENTIGDCCWRHYSQYDEERAKMAHIESIMCKYERESESLRKTAGDSCWSQNRRKILLFLEDPTSSRPAKVWGLFYLMLVLCSVSVQCLASHPISRYQLPEPRANISAIENPKLLALLSTEVKDGVWYIDIACTCAFVLDIFIRFALSTPKKEFLKSKYNIIDFIALFPMVALFALDLAGTAIWGNVHLYNFVFLMSLLGVFRTVRLVKFARHYQTMRLLLLALRASIREILLLLMLISIGMLIFSNLIYYAEFSDASSDFETVPVGLWWSLVTMTTVGYGDVYPVTFGGYVVGGLCALAGMFSTGLPIPIVASNFNLYCSYLKDSNRIKKRRAKQKADKEQKSNDVLHSKVTTTPGDSTVDLRTSNSNLNKEASDKPSLRKRKQKQSKASEGSAMDIVVNGGLDVAGLQGNKRQTHPRSNGDVSSAFSKDTLPRDGPEGFTPSTYTATGDELPLGLNTGDPGTLDTAAGDLVTNLPNGLLANSVVFHVAKDAAEEMELGPILAMT